MSWRLAESLKKLREQVNAAYPGRDKASDGAIGDAAHASRSSDHNPWVKDARGTGVVTAIDIDADLSPTVKVGVLVDALLRSRDPRIKYIIFNRQIYASYPVGAVPAWKGRPYTGVNAHTLHAHISVNSAPMLYDSRAEWNIGTVQAAAAAEPILEIPPVVVPPIAARPIPPCVEPTAAQTSPILGLPTGLPTGTWTGGETTTPSAAAASTPPLEGGEPRNLGAFNAFVPQIDTAKSWVKRATAGTTIGAILAFVFNLPVWLQIGMFSLVVIIVIGGIVMFVKYHKEIFAYVTQMNTLRATDGAGNPVIVGRPPTD